MDKGPQEDPGGDPPPSGMSPDQGSEITDLKEQFEHQQVLIAQLKEMLRKTDPSNVSQEKVDRYASTLSKMTVRAKKSKLKKETAASTEKGEKSGVGAPVNEKISLLRRQLEENKAKLAERGRNQKGIEEMVTQLKAQFDDSLQLISDTSLNFSNIETKTDYSKDSSPDELYNILVTKEKKIADLNQKVQKLETSVLDLQENLKEKDCVIDARTKAITLMTESLSKKGKTTQDTLDETKEQMREMQENFVKLENEMKTRQIKLLDDLRLKNLEIAELQDVNDNLKSQTYPSGDSECLSELRENVEELQSQIKELENSNVNLISRNKELESLIELNENNRTSELEEKIKTLEVLIENMKKEHENQIGVFQEKLGVKDKEEEMYMQQIRELKTAIEDSSKSSLEKSEGKAENTEEVNKLRKDLDDINKYMNKIKAEHKKKVKILNKKIDSFKKIGDPNAYIVKMSNENDILKEKIAELEEEKGNYQLKMIDSISKDSPTTEDIEELTRKLENLETENSFLKKQLEVSNEKTVSLSNLQLENVALEVTEELCEKLKKEKVELELIKESLEEERLELQQKINNLVKEKSEIQTKLDHYIQENIELIDKLEKLSAEKVSSAESIEIVENLTQQEKLELEEYQKNLDPQSGKLKMSQEHLEGTPDLNDSVNQLNEETSELLQKIELFTVERREVMEKMEFLTNENSQLSLKLKQIENNRDLLTETYEQLQSEKEELDDKIKEIENDNKNLKDTINSMKKEYDIEEKEELKKKLFDLEGEYIKLCEVNENLNKELKANAEMIHEKDNLEVELKEARNKIQKLEDDLMRNLEEINTYKSVIEDNKEEFIHSATHLNELNDRIYAKEGELKECKAEIDSLNSLISEFKKTINNLEDENAAHKENINKIELLEEQLDGLKKTLNDNLIQLADYENELEENTTHTKELHQQLKELKNKNLELQELLGGKNEENNTIIKQLKEEIKELENQIKSKDEVIHRISSEMKEKFLSLQKQTDNNSESLENIREPLQKKIDELTTKNGTLVAKMKKIAANLKKKTQACQELEEQLLSSNEKWEKELNEKNSRIVETEEIIESLKLQIDMYQTEAQVQRNLETNIKMNIPQNQTVGVRSDITLQEELSGSSIIAETISSSTNTSLSKIQELELIIETQENDIVSYKERISVLEEMLAKIDEKRESLEQKTNELGAQLQDKSLSFEEISKSEDILEEKLKNLVKCNEDLNRKFEETSRENINFFNENKILKETEEKLKHKLNVAQERVNELLEVQQNVILLEQELEKSKVQINHLEQEVKKIELEKTEIEETAMKDIERLDNDWQLQFETLSKEKTELYVQSEKLQEKISELMESEQVLSEKTADLEYKLEKSYETQEAYNNQLSAQKSKIDVFQKELEEKRAEIHHLQVEIINLKSMQQNESSLIAEMDNLKFENNNLQIRTEELMVELNSLNNALQLANDELQQLKNTNAQVEVEHVQENSQITKPLFAWPAQEEDPFNFISAQDPVEAQTQPSTSSQSRSTDENYTQNLIQKIRTLEFMLNNVESERDEVLTQCSHLSNELMRLVYAKEGEHNIIQQIPASTENIDGRQPVNEPICVKKETYLCHPDGNTNQNIQPSVESQILPDDFLEETAASRNKLQQLEFTSSRDISDNTVPFVEETCQKKEAYLCYPTETIDIDSSQPQSDQVNLDAFGVDDDGWGWNPEEARLEEQHKNEYEANPLRMKIVELEDKIKVLEMERDNKNKEFQELQVKSGKLIKKLKEMKNKNEKLQHGKRQEEDDFFNLENAIQEELKLQIETLEKKISEVVNELSKEKSDKQSLQKKIETLSSSNQRMMETKEKQDIEMLMWQRKSEELQSKLDQVEWGDSGSSPEKTHKHEPSIGKEADENTIKLHKQIAELNEMIKELTIDNEELQALLEEQRSLRITAEKTKSVEPIPDNMKTESEYMEIVNKNNSLVDEIKNIAYEKKKLQEELNEIIKQNGQQSLEFENLQSEKHQLEVLIKERTAILEELSNNSNQLQTENERLEKILSERSYDENLVQELLEKIKNLEENQSKTLLEETTVLMNEKESLLSDIHEKTSFIEVLHQEKESLLKELHEKEEYIHKLKMDMEEKTSSLKTELDTQIENIERLMHDNECLNIQKKDLEEQIQKILEQNQRKDVEFAAQIETLNQEWQILVDQRGSDIAESWKLHLDSRETEFSQIQNALRKEISDLEEKCNGLVNENNELRKNVDTEIRNEVDRVSALQQQINERQLYIHELTQAVNDKKMEIETAEQLISQLRNNIASLESTVEAQTVKITELQIVVDATQKQFDDKRIIVEGIVKKLEERSSSPILFDLESVLEELNRQLGNAVSEAELKSLHKSLADKDSIISNIQNELSSKLEEITNYESVIHSHIDTIEKLKHELESNDAEKRLNEVTAKLSEKETLLGSLQNDFNIKSKEVQSLMETIEELKLYSADNERQVKVLSDRLLEKDEMISALTYQLQETQNLKENESENIQNLQYSLQQYQMQYGELSSNLTQKLSLIDALNEELEKQQKIHVERESEVQKLKIFVEDLQKSHESELIQLEKDKNEIIENQNQEVDILKNQLSQMELYVNEAKSERETIPETVNHLQFQLEEHRKYIEELNKQIESYRTLNEQLSQKLADDQKRYDEQNILLDEEEKQVAELKTIIEEQVLKIEDLKQKLFEKSNDYDSLIAEMDVRKEDLNVPQQITNTRPPMGQGQLIGPTTEDDLHEWVSRPELDIALYMLHQRDVRCEELTVELTQLLEERDTLQLRLSNALREKEEIRRLAIGDGKGASSSNEDSPSKGAISKGKVSEIVLKSSGTELATEAQEMSVKESEDRLENKLSELKNIGYKKDKTLLDEQQQRRLQQLSIMQQHIDEASRLPSEAAARLVDANYTLSRDVQSPSKVLLNWLWGKSTPKVNEL